MAHKAPTQLVIRDWGRRKGIVRYGNWKRRLLFAYRIIACEIAELGINITDEALFYEYTRYIEMGIPFDEVMLEKYQTLCVKFCLGEPAAD